MTTFRVTQAVYSYRRYIVEAPDWQQAKAKVERAAPPDNETSCWEDTEGVTPIADVVDDDAAFFDEVAFVDSEDGAESYYERG